MKELELVKVLVRVRRPLTKYELAKRAGMPRTTVLVYLRKLREVDAIEVREETTKGGFKRHLISPTLYGVALAFKYGVISLEEGGEYLGYVTERFFEKVAEGLNAKALARGACASFLASVRLFGMEEFLKGLDVNKLADIIAKIPWSFYSLVILALSEKVKEFYKDEKLLLPFPKVSPELLSLRAGTYWREYLKFLGRSPLIYYFAMWAADLIADLHGKPLCITVSEEKIEVREFKGGKLGSVIVKEAAGRKLPLSLARPHVLEG